MWTLLCGCEMWELCFKGTLAFNNTSDSLCYKIDLFFLGIADL